MKLFRHLLTFAFLLIGSLQVKAQLAEILACQATCMDPTKSSITGRQPNQNGVSPNINLPCGSGTSEDNPAWWILRPSGNSLTFAINASNCVAGGCGIGVQMTIWEGDNCGSITALNCKVGTNEVLTVSVTPCKVYFLQIDGLCECRCDIQLTYDKNQILKEVLPPVITGPKVLCKGATGKFNAAIPPPQNGCRPDSWKWTVEPAGAGTITGITEEGTLKLSGTIPANGKIKVCAEPVFKGKCPPVTKKACYEVEVLELKPAKCEVTICPEVMPFLYEFKKYACFTSPNPALLTAEINPESVLITKALFPPGSETTKKYTYSVVGSGCKGDLELKVKVPEVKPLVLPAVILCEGEKRVVKGEEFTCADAGNSLKKIIKETSDADKELGRCDSTFNFIVQCIKIKTALTGKGTLDCTTESLTLNAGGAGTTTLPNNVTSTIFTGVGTREYAWSKDGSVLPGATAATLVVTEPGTYAVTLSYTYEITQTINGLPVKVKKTCTSVKSETITGSSTSTVAETPIELAPPCANGTSTYYITPAPLATYVWTVTGGATIQGSATGTTITVVNKGVPFDVCVEKDACDKKDKKCITITPIPPPVAPIIKGLTPVCQGDSVSYKIDNASVYGTGTSYKWAVVNGTISGYNNDSTEVYVKWSKTATSGEVSAVVKDRCGSSPTTTFPVVINSFPKKPVEISGKKVVCINETQSYTVTDAQFATGYQWYLSSGGTMVKDTGKTVSIKWTEDGPHTLCVKSINKCLPEGSDTFCISINVRPFPRPDAGSDREVCSLTNLKLAAIPSDPANTGKWTQIPSNPVVGVAVFSAATTPNSNVTVPACGKYRFVWTESNGTCSAADTMEVTFSTPPVLKSTVINCDAAAKTFKVTLVVDGCDGPFKILASKYPGTITNNTANTSAVIVIDNIPDTDKTEWGVVVAGKYCNATFNVKSNCDCKTRAGNMALEPVIAACVGEKLTAKHKGDQVNDGNDVGRFVLHTLPNGFPFLQIDDNTTGIFEFNPNTMTCGTTYYVTYVYGTNLAGEPDPADPCLQVTPQGQPVRWDCIPSPNAGPKFEICGLTATMKATAPVAPITGKWTGSFSSIDDATKPDAKITVAKAGTYKFTWTETSGSCSESSDVSVTFNKSELTTSTDKLCDATNEKYSITVTISGGKAPYTLIGPSQVVPKEYVLSDIPSGDVVKFRITDALGCDTIDYEYSHLCGCTTAAGAFAIAKPEVCVGTNIIATAPGAVKDANDIEEYLFADGCDPATATILARNATGNFSFDAAAGMVCDKAYKIIYLIGNDDGTGKVSLTDKCKKVLCKDVKFICNPTPTAAVVSVDTCGLKATLTATPGLNGQWTVVGNKPVTFTPNATTPNVTASNLTYDTYTFVWTENNNGCTATASAPVTIKKKGDLSYTVDTLCSQTGKTYQLKFTLTGAAPFGLHPTSTATGTFVGNVFTTDAVNSGQKIKVCFTDNLVCSPLCAEFEPKCPCLSNAGQMSQNLAEACVDGTITVSVPPASSGLFLDPDDVGEFYLHSTSGSNNQLGTIFAHNTTGVFSFAAPMVAGTTYYVSYVVGDKSGANPNEVDLTDPCLDVSLGQPVIFHALPTAKISDNSTICNGTTAPINFTLTGKAAYEIIFTANNVAQTPLSVTQNAYVQIVKPTETTEYAFSKITDANGCVTNLTNKITVTVNEPVSAGTASPSRRFCLGTETTVDLEGELNNEDVGGTWTCVPNGPWFSASGATFSTKTAPTGTYTCTYTVKGKAPCSDDAEPFKITIDPIPVANAGPDQDLNCDASEVSIGGASSEGKSIEYQWTTIIPGPALTNTKSRQTSTRNPGTFVIRVSDSVSGCFSSDTVVVTNNIVKVTGFEERMTEPSCFGEDNGAIDITKVIGGTPQFQYSINNGPFTPYKNFVNLKAGVYTMRIKDAKGCEFEKNVTVTQPEEIDVTVPDDVDLELGNEYVIQAQINFPETMLKRVTWAPSCDSCITTPKNKSLSYKIKPNETTLYTVTVVNTNGCTSSDNILLRVNKPRRVYIPNVFYPDSDDDRNRKLKVFLGIDVLKVHYFRVFDRWGNAVYEDLDFSRKDVANQDKGWDGQFKGQLAIPGVYTYACLVEFIDGYKEVYKGDVLLVEK